MSSSAENLSTRLLRSATILPNIPSESVKETLNELERLKTTSVNITIVENRAPVTCGSNPERIVVEMRKLTTREFVTYWYFWSYDRWPMDHKDWEPLTLVYDNGALIRIDGRVHDGLVSYSPPANKSSVIVYFPVIGHTPVVKVQDRNRDINLCSLNDGFDSSRWKWLNYCYRDAKLKNWKVCTAPKLETGDGPVLDLKNWKEWGKHSIYLKL